MTIQRLMLIIAAIGIDLGVIAAVFSSPSIWGNVALYAVTVGLLSTSLVGAALRQGNERASWLGIAVFGWLFLLPGLALTMREDPWTRAGVFLGAQLFGLIVGGVHGSSPPAGDLVAAGATGNPGPSIGDDPTAPR
jgi:hypothetical protein